MRRHGREGFVKHGAFGQVIMHPSSAVQSGHDLTEVAGAIVCVKLAALFSLANVFAIAAVIGHAALPNTRSARFCPPPT